MGLAIAPSGGATATTVLSTAASTALTFQITLVDATQQAQLLAALGGPLGSTLGSALAALGSITATTAAAGVTVTDAGPGAGPSASPSPSSSPVPGVDNAPALSMPAIIGISVGASVAVIAAAIAAGVCIARRRASRTSRTSDPKVSQKRATELARYTVGKANPAHPDNLAVAAAPTDTSPLTQFLYPPFRGPGSSGGAVVLPGAATAEHL